jgi:ABC-type uncharacterized transport system permease subunit
MRLRQFVPAVFILALLASALLAFFPMARVFSPIILLLYLFANLSASTISATKKGWEYFPFLPFIFAILHFSYGLGFLSGLIHFWNRWNDKTGRVPSLSYD